MKVVLEVTSYTTHKVLTEYADSIEEAKNGFEPCEDLSGSEVTGGNCNINDAYEVIDCPDCKGRRVIPVKTPEWENLENKTIFPDGFLHTCKRCHGDGYIRPLGDPGVQK